MNIDLSEAQRHARLEFRDFAAQLVAPYADEHDRRQEMPLTIIKEMVARGYQGAPIPSEFGGGGMDVLTWGLLCEEIGGASASLLSMLTVHAMVAQALCKWGTDDQRRHWLPRLAAGEVLGAFALTEPNIGSDAANVETTAVMDGGQWRLNGEKKWISFGQAATLFLVFAKVDGKAAAFLVERSSEGLSTQPITGMLGFRSAMLADVHLHDCRVPAENLLGRIGFGFSHVAGSALDMGRYCIAWGCLGLAQAGLTASLAYAGNRGQFGVFLKDHPLIQELVADMITQTGAARMVCYRAAILRQQGDPSTLMESSIAKYFTSRVAVKVAADAVQIHGANGCSDRFPVSRYLRDAKIMEIIEGSSQMQQIMISNNGFKNHRINSGRPGNNGSVEK
jgi:glutaryl-CoA dehydrogenase (non-decarboxylating)